MKQKEFRVFYGLIGTYDDMASPVHSQNKTHEETKCEAQINSNNYKIAESSVSESSENTTSFSYNIKQWF